jgi:hypothetical protein
MQHPATLELGDLRGYTGGLDRTARLCSLGLLLRR